MRKIRASVLRKVEESRLTNKELTVFLHICQYQTDAGTVSGIYYKDICNALKISNQSFYSSLYRLRDCGLINLWKADKIDWDIQIIGNDCTDIESVKKEGYLSVADGLFASEKFRKLKANEKVMAMRLLVYCRSGQRTYKEAKASFSMEVPVVSADVGGQKELINEKVGKIVKLRQNEKDAWMRTSRSKKIFDSAKRTVLHWN